MGYYFSFKFAEFDDVFPKAKIGQCRLLPIKKTKNQKPFIASVDKIIQQKHSGKDTTALEAHIDQMVYALYNLTYDEACIIEGNTEWLAKDEYEKLIKTYDAIPV